MKKINPTLLFLTLPLFLFAQYQPGNIQRSDGTTLSGYISHDTEYELARRIHFKENSETEQFLTYSPIEILGYTFENGDTYSSISITSSRDGVEINEKGFAKLVADGTIMLFLYQPYKEENKFEFYARKDGELRRLSNEELSLDPTISIKSKLYQGKLKALTFDCPNLKVDYQQLPFTRKRIVGVVDAYNSCKDTEYSPLVNAVKIQKEKRHYLEVFAGPLIVRYDAGGPFPTDRYLEEEIYGAFGLAIQKETYKPTLSRNIIVHNSLEVFKLIPWKVPENSDYPVPDLNLAFNFSAHFLLNREAKVKFYTRLGGRFVLEIGEDTFVRPTPNLGIGTYLPYGARIRFDLARISLFSKHAITAWQFAYAMPLGGSRSN